MATNPKICRNLVGYKDIYSSSYIEQCLTFSIVRNVYKDLTELSPDGMAIGWQKWAGVVVLVVE